jgi:NADH-quinone oxidoreductase subunit L
MLAAATEMTETVLSSGWFLENAWIIPIIPAISFALIIFFGKRMPKKGSEFGATRVSGWAVPRMKGQQDLHERC